MNSNNIRRLTTILLLVWLPIFVWSQHATVAQIRETALDFFNHAIDTSLSLLPERWDSTSLVINEFSVSQQASLYRVRNGEQSLIMASDLRLPAIIALLDDTIWRNPGDLPPSFRDYLSYYEDVIASIQDTLLDAEINPQWTASPQHNQPVGEQIIVDPLLSKNGTQIGWRQHYNESGSDNCDKAYNLFCPPITGGECGRALVGCVAVAMAQVMWYWEWPYSVAIRTVSHLPIYDWKNMPPLLYDTTPQCQVNQVAQLLYDCGRAVDMNYGAEGSYAYTEDCKNSMKNYFKYSPSIESIGYSSSNINLIRNDLEAGKPVLASGRGSSGGHMFVIDGYKIKDGGFYFHINWGWGSYYNTVWVELSDIRIKNMTFNSLRTFIINIEPKFPSCDGVYTTTNWGNNFEIYHGGDISLNNKVIPNNWKGYIHSGTQIQLLPGFQIKEGATVHLGIRDMHCSSPSIASINKRTPQPAETEQDTTFPVFGFPSTTESIMPLIMRIDDKHIMISESVSIAKVWIYSISGQLILRTRQPDIDISFLSSGVYIVTAQTTNGTILQGKFVHL